MSEFTTVLNECAAKQMAKGRCTVDDVVSCAWQDHPEVFAVESERLAWQAARREAKRILDHFTDDDEIEQLPLPDVRLPSAIAVRGEKGIYYVRSDQAHWHELQAGKTERNLNVLRAQAKLDQYNDALDRLRPLMESDPECTVEDALRREKGAA